VRALGPSENGLDAAHELAWREGLGDVVVGAELQAEHTVHLVPARREHDDRCVGVGAQVTGDIEAGLPRQHDVEHDDIGGYLLEHHLGACGVARGVHLVARLLQCV
jgi:hypothetical protein